MVRGPFYDQNGIKRGAWSSEEDDKLRTYVETHGHCNWRELPRFAGLSRCGKSCRLRWVNYLRPDVKRGNYSVEEETLIIKLHQEHGNKWSLIAAHLPGRTDNEVKNHWHTILKKRTTLSRESSQFETTNNIQNTISYMTDQAESSTVSNIDLSTSSILESSPLSSTEISPNTELIGFFNSSFYDQSSTSLAEVNNYFDVCEEYYNYTTGSDFWTEPFLVDKDYMAIQNEYQTYTSFNNDGMENFFGTSM